MKHRPKEINLWNYDFKLVREKRCKPCGLRTKQEVYEGHTFAQGSTLIICLHCKSRWIE